MNRRDLYNEFMAVCHQFGVVPDAFGNGNFDAEIAIVSETYGEAERKSAVDPMNRVAFAGGSGALLWSHLRKKCGLERSMVWTTNVIKSQAHFVNMSIITSTTEYDAWRQVLLWELRKLPNLKCILVLGSVALKALTGVTGIREWRGSVVDIDLGDGKKILGFCTYNPAFTLKKKMNADGEIQLAEPRNEIDFIRDMAKFSHVLVEGDKRPSRTFHLWPTKTDALDWIAYLHDYAVTKRKPIAYDIEVQHRQIVCIGFSAQPLEGYCINWCHVEGRKVHNQFDVEDELEIRLAIAKLVGDPKVSLVAQNGDYDRSLLWFLDRILTQPHWFDTMLAEHLLHPTGRIGLDHLASTYTWESYYKSDKTTFYDDPDVFFRYNIKDACVTREVVAPQVAALTKKGLLKFFFGHTMRLQPHLQAAQVLGTNIDHAKLDAASNLLRDDMKEIQIKFDQLCSDAAGEPVTINPLSRIQFGKFLKRLGVVFHHRTRTGRPQLDKTAKALISNTYAQDPHIPAILAAHADYVKESTHYSNFVDMKLDDDGRFRAAYSEQGTREAPGRLSSEKTHWGTGRNAQNFPHRISWLFIAEPGYQVCYIDLEQAEARYVGWDANIEEWINDFEKARLNPGTFDCHRQLAALIYNVSYDEVPKEDHFPDGTPTKRFIGKRSRHGLNYRLGPDTFAEKNGLSLSVAQFVYAKYHRMYPELRRWWKRLEDEMRTNRVIYNSYGRPLYIEERLTTEALRSVVAFRPQSTIGDKMKRVWYMCHDDDDWPTGARIVRNVHDALYAIAPEKDAKTALSIMVRHAEEPINVGPFPMIIPAAPKLSVPDESGVHRFSTLKGVTL